MYVVAPYNRNLGQIDEEKGDSDGHHMFIWKTSTPSPEWAVVRRVVQLAKRSYEYMQTCLRNFDDTDWPAIFHETPNSFKSYSVLMRVDKSFIVDNETSSSGGNLEVDENEEGRRQSSFTRSMKALSAGPKILRQKVYRNLTADKSTDVIIPAYQPLQEVVGILQERFGKYALFFFNEYCPEVIGVVWRPGTFAPVPFSAISSEQRCPQGDEWGNGSLILRNVGDLLREMGQYTKDIVTNIVIFDDKCLAHFSKKQKVSGDISGEESSEEETPAGDGR